MRRSVFLLFVSIFSIGLITVQCRQEPMDPLEEEVVVDDNADENEGDDDCGITDASFTDVQNILSRYSCSSCHAGGSLNMRTYAGVKASVDNGTLLGSIKHQSGFRPMPENGNKMPTCDIRTIEIWIENGANNN